MDKSQNYAFPDLVGGGGGGDITHLNFNFEISKN
jgi:hypothetical protein